jgi:hypothetical protein
MPQLRKHKIRLATLQNVFTMKEVIKVYILLMCLNTGCSQPTPKNEATESSQAASIPDTIKKPVAEVQAVEEFDNLADFGELVPITVIDPKNQKAYEKYGIDLSGNCYTCDLAAISINKKSFDIINVCDKDDFYRHEKFTYKASPNEFIVNTEKNQFIFTKVDPAPVYELKITGDKVSLKNKIVSKFYTQKKELNKFKQHDCGEFDG